MNQIAYLLWKSAPVGIRSIVILILTVTIAHNLNKFVNHSIALTKTHRVSFGIGKFFWCRTFPLVPIW